MIYIILISIGIARALQTFNLPDYKPFNCQSCLAFWSTFVVCLCTEPELVGISFISYLISDLILTYENK